MPTEGTGSIGKPGIPRKRITVIGHPLSAGENRLAFMGWQRHRVDLILPRAWNARSLGHAYAFNWDAPAGIDEGTAASAGPAMHPLDTRASGRNSLFLWVGLGPLLRRLRPDIIYCWEEPWCLSTWQVLRAARRMGIPVVFYTAENRPKRLPWPFRILVRAAFRACPACVAPTEEIAARVKAWGYGGRIFVIPLWIRPRREVNADAAEKRLVYVGRLIPLKRVDLLVECLALLPGFRLRIIGDGPERLRLETLVKALGLGTRVEFRGHVDNGRLEDSLEGASVLVLPTGENARQAEQFGKAAIEGVSCGLPVLASRTGNLADLARIFPTLSAMDMDDPERMAEAVSGVFRAFPDKSRLAASRRLAQEIYGPDAAARSLEDAFATLAASRAGSPALPAEAAP
ncbi:MAG: putative glycosyltransferase [Fibrobacteres bacterium]|nr:putative glycosyltransferase [Fibrobacterota bacterium]